MCLVSSEDHFWESEEFMMVTLFIIFTLTTFPEHVAKLFSYFVQKIQLLCSENGLEPRRARNFISETLSTKLGTGKVKNKGRSEEGQSLV